MVNITLNRSTNMLKDWAVMLVGFTLSLAFTIPVSLQKNNRHPYKKKRDEITSPPKSTRRSDVNLGMTNYHREVSGTRGLVSSH